MTSRVLFTCVLALAGCNNSSPRVVTLGDSVSSNPTYRLSYVGLLAENDDTLFPAFRGKGFDAVFGEDVKLVRLDRGGDSYHSLATGDSPVCTCAGGACDAKSEPCLDTDASGETTVIVELGGNDLLSAFVKLLGREDLRANPNVLLDDLAKDIHTVLGMTQDASRFGPSPRVFVMNAYDPSDGSGDIAAIAADILPPNFDIDVEVVTATLALSMIDGFNRTIESEAHALGATMIDTHSAFAGHGYHFDEPSHPSYHAADPTRWIRGIFDPTLRGAHELRRLVWSTLAHESITDVPANLPPESTLGLPAVPENGWAKAVVDSKITEELHSDATDVTWPNESDDPNAALGAPDLPDDAATVALGVLGAYIVLDLGASTGATDGEGDDLVVLEQGTQSLGTPEPYRVSVAEDASGPFTTIADGRGERSFDLGTAGIRHARYVRIESLAAASDVLGGVGSPLAPGPELDAVGAVHPGAP